MGRTVVSGHQSFSFFAVDITHMLECSGGLHMDMDTKHRADTSVSALTECGYLYGEDTHTL